jgi:hypothetical protein
MTPNIADIIRHHVALEVRCIDRLYLNGYMPKLQTSGGLCYFLRDHRGHPIPSPALFKPMHDRFVTAVHQFATQHQIPVVPFESGQDKDAIVAKYRARFTRREGIVILGVVHRREIVARSTASAPVSSKLKKQQAKASGCRSAGTVAGASWSSLSRERFEDGVPRPFLVVGENPDGDLLSL